jgi:two-component system OmpR family sensor kinase
MKRRDGPAPSLRRLVQFHVSMLIVLVFVCFSILTYAAERYTIRFSQDRRLQRIALSVPETVRDADLRSINIKLTHGRDDFVLQIWHGDKQVYRSHEDVDLARMTRPGFTMQSWRGEGWTSFCRLAGPLTIQVSQSPVSPPPQYWQFPALVRS